MTSRPWGLSAGAAEKLCSGELNAETVSQLLEHPLFAKLVNQITQFKDATIAASLAGMNAMLSKLGQLMHQVGKKSPALQKAAIQAAQDMESLKHPLYTDTSAMEATFLELVADLKKGARSYMMQFQKLTSTAVVKLVQQVQNHGRTYSPQGHHAGTNGGRHSGHRRGHSIHRQRIPGSPPGRHSCHCSSDRKNETFPRKECGENVRQILHCPR